MPYYKVVATAQVECVVFAESAEEAGQLVYEEADYANAGVRETSSPKLIDGEEDLQRALRHADQIFK